MAYTPRKNRLEDIFPNAPKFRMHQIEEAIFSPSVLSWNDVTCLPKEMRNQLAQSIPFISLETKRILESKKQDAFKAIVGVDGGKEIETVLMKNRRGHWTVCVSSQVGCAMGCAFCATGKMGLSRHLHADEIVDQYRLWAKFLYERQDLPQLISNVVFMGMGEPLANYDNVKTAIKALLTFTALGETRITVSTVGILPMLERILVDADWPRVRLAISLHSAVAETREKIMPSSCKNFLALLADWSKRYLESFGNRRHHLTFEYVMLDGINDSTTHAAALAKFVKSIGNVRVNLIPYNFTDSEFECSQKNRIDSFESALERSGVVVTRRKSIGEDIAAACGQLTRLSLSRGSSMS
jgi:23S rRNA (adenine2503-C2)-methyltransferase